jgi:hypothetical protein
LYNGRAPIHGGATFSVRESASILIFVLSTGAFAVGRRIFRRTDGRA